MTEAPVPGPVPRFEIAEWRQFGVVAGVTGRGESGHPFDLGLAGASTPVGRVMNNWRALLGALAPFRGATISRQVHGILVRWQSTADGLVIQEGADGHATEEAGGLLAVTVADCVPVYLVDPEERRAALLHAGWRGTAAGILRPGIEGLRQKGSSVERLLMHCGVGICGECYEVGSEVFAACGLTLPRGWAWLTRHPERPGGASASIGGFPRLHKYLVLRP